MSESNVLILPLPNWNANATPAERLRELALLAEEFPERFEKFVMAFTEDLGPRTKTRYHCYGVKTTEAIGMFEIAKIQLWDAVNE